MNPHRPLAGSAQVVVMSGIMLEDSMKKKDLKKPNKPNQTNKKKKADFFFSLMIRDPSLSCVTRSWHTLCQQLTVSNAKKTSKYILLIFCCCFGGF